MSESLLHFNLVKLMSQGKTIAIRLATIFFNKIKLKKSNLYIKSFLFEYL